MKAVVVTRNGGPEVLEMLDIPAPTPKAGEVLVRVEAFGINFADTMIANGTYPTSPKPPFVAGMEYAGTIEGTGERVMGLVPSGACAELVAAPRAVLFPAPKQWSAAEAAAFLVNYLTAYFAYWMAAVKSGDRVLIHAVAGGVGTAAVEIGKIMGLEMYGTSSSPEKLERVKKLGLDHGINYREQDYEQAIAQQTNGEGVHAVLEMLGGEHTAKSTRCLRALGRLIVYGTATGRPPQFDFSAMFSRNASVHPLWLTPLFAYRDLITEAMEKMMRWGAEGKVHPIVGHELPMEKAAEGYRLLLERKNFGKVVLHVK